jgi:hypothetical protein
MKWNLTNFGDYKAYTHPAAEPRASGRPRTHEPASGTARTLPRMHALRRAVDEIAVALLDHDIRAEQLPIQSCGQRRARRAAGLVG